MLSLLYSRTVLRNNISWCLTFARFDNFLRLRIGIFPFDRFTIPTHCFWIKINLFLSCFMLRVSLFKQRQPAVAHSGPASFCRLVWGSVSLLAEMALIFNHIGKIEKKWKWMERTIDCTHTKGLTPPCLNYPVNWNYTSYCCFPGDNTNRLNWSIASITWISSFQDPSQTIFLTM